MAVHLISSSTMLVSWPFHTSYQRMELSFSSERIIQTAKESNREGRIVILSSEAHRYAYKEGIRFYKINDESGYHPLWAYGQSKLANILHANELARRFKEEGDNITANSLHPGEILTNLHGWFYNLVKFTMSYMLKNAQQGAATTCYVALHPQLEGVSGEYFVDNNKAKRTAQAEDQEMAKKLWDFSVSLTETNVAS